MTQFEKAFEWFTKGMTLPGDLELLSIIAPGRKKIVEIGTARGLGALMLSSFGSYVITIDDYNFYHYKYKVISEYLRNIAGVKSMCDESSFAIYNFRDESIDMVYIDGDHTFKGVNRDFLSWLPKVKRNGLIAFHDMDEGHVDVWNFYNDVLKKSKDVKERHYETQFPTIIKVFEKL